MNTINNTLRKLTIDQPQQFRNLTAFPLLRADQTEPGYITLSEAIHNQTAHITEISDSGSVPELLLENTGDKHILILDGEELIGAKQNRVTNLTILAAARSKTVLPVSCVEAGRWSYQTEYFQTSERTHFSRGRAAKAAALSANLKATGTYAADQGMIWDDIAAKQVRMKVSSSTAAMSDMFEQNRDATEDYVNHIKDRDFQVGVIFAIDGQVEGMDLFATRATLAEMLPKLVRSFAIDALESADSKAPVPEHAVAEHFLDRIAAAHADTYPGVGLGTDVRLSAPLVAGGGLVYEDTLMHLAAFAKAGPDNLSEAESRWQSRFRNQRYARMRRREQH